MNTSSSPRRFNYQHAVLVTGLVLSLLAVMFRPAGADAGLPSTVDVFSAWDEDSPSSVRLDGLPTVTRDYDVILKGDKKPTTVELTGVKISELLEKVGANTQNVQFVKVRYGTLNDGAISLISLNTDSPERPPILMSSGSKPGRGAFATPAIVPGQAGSKPLNESDIVPFKTGSKVEPIKIVPGKPGGQIISVKLEAKKTSKGEIKYTPRVLNGTKGAARKTQWFEYDKNGKVTDHGTSSTYTTDNATKGTAEHVITAVVTETLSGSTGTGSANYTSQKKEKGSTKNPYPAPTSSTGGNTGGGNGTGTTGTGNSNLTQNGTGSSNTIPNFNQTTPTPTPTAPTTQPNVTPEPSAPTSSSATASSVDTTAITNVAQNVNGTPGLHTVTGVLLSNPTAMPISSSGSAGASTAPLSVLPDPVQDQINNIFQPVESTEDLWAYLLAILFAFSISGAVREWVNP